VDYLVRGGSSPLGRTGKAPHSGAFLCSGWPVCLRPTVDVLLSGDKYVHRVRPFGARDNTVDVPMSVSFHRGGWEVRRRDVDGRRRARGFATEEVARAFDTALAEVSPTTRRADTARHGRSGGVYSYRTAEGVRWRFVYRRSDGTQTTKRGFASARAARDARRRLIEQVERGEVRHTKETFAGYWDRWLAQRRPYLEPGTWTGYEIAGRKRLLPAFGARSLGTLSVDDVREFLAELAEEISTLGRSRQRRSTTRLERSSPVSTLPFKMASWRSTRRCACSGSLLGTSSATTSVSRRSRGISTPALTSIGRSPSF
jgi:Phage integrase, N-terminal SAM-like domain